MVKIVDERCRRYEPFFGKWRFDRELGRGAFGQVYRIYWDILIRMELLYPLDTFFRRKDATQYDVVKMWMDIACALFYCEKQNIIHRDIKPANIMISESGNYKLSDFGVARKNMEGAMASTRVGTLKYMAPEVELNLKYDKRVDYYSLGCVVYYFFNKGRMPFYPPYPQTVSADAVLQAEEMRLAGKKVPGLPWLSKEVNQILLKCLEPKPENRCRSAQDLYDVLYKLLQTRGQFLQTRYLNIDNTEIPGRSERSTGGKVFTGKSSFGKSSEEKGSVPEKKKLPPVLLAIVAGAFLVVGIGGIVYGLFSGKDKYIKVVSTAEVGEKQTETPENESATDSQSEVLSENPQTLLSVGTVEEICVRSYKTVSGEKYWSAWSKVKSVRTKRR